MKPTKTAKTGKQPPRKKAAEAGGKKKKSASAKSVRGSGVGAVTDRKKKPARAAAVRDETSGKNKKSKSGKVRTKNAEAAPSAATAVSRKTPAKKNAGKLKPPKTGSTKKPEKNLRKTAPTSAGTRPGKRDVAGQLPVEKKSDGTAAVRPDLPAKKKKSSARTFSKRTGGRSKPLRKPPAVKSPDEERPMAIEEILPAELPEEYGENEFFLIPVEPRVVYASWEIAAGSLPGEQGGLEVRFFDVTDGRTGEADSRAFLDIPVRKRVGDAFFRVGIHGREVVAEIGRRGANGHFRPLLRSRKVLIPSSLEPGVSGTDAELPETGSYGSRPPRND
jgi:Domain of unknown function (DUF4912)